MDGGPDDTGATSRPGSGDLELDRAFFGAPDPVELFATSVDHALRQLRVEVAGLRAERDGLRLEVEGLRAKLLAAQAQLQQRSALDGALAELRALVYRLSGASPVIPAGTAEAPAADERAPAEPSALEQLRAMGLWPPRTRDEPAPEPPAAAAPPPPPEVEHGRDGSVRSPAPADGVAPPPADEVPAPVTPPRSRLRTWSLRVGVVLGALVVVVVLLVSLGPRVLPYQTYFVRSGSMEPTISTGSMVVLTKTDASTLGEGDIITFERPDDPGTLVTHRIVGIERGPGGPVFVTRGDANGSPDPWRVPATGDGWEYAFDVPVLGYVFGFLGTMQGRVLLLALPVAVLGALSLAERPRRRRGADR